MYKTIYFSTSDIITANDIAKKHCNTLDAHSVREAIMFSILVNNKFLRVETDDKTNDNINIVSIWLDDFICEVVELNKSDSIDIENLGEFNFIMHGPKVKQSLECFHREHKFDYRRLYSFVNSLIAFAPINEFFDEEGAQNIRDHYGIDTYKRQFTFNSFPVLD